MDLTELKRTFNLSETYVERIRAFRKHRVDIWENDELGETPVTLPVGPKIILHSIPLNSASGSKVDLGMFNLQKVGSPPLFYSPEPRFNLDGLLITHNSKRCYQIFRNGSVEYVQPLELEPGVEGTIVPYFVEDWIINGLQYQLRISKYIGIGLPIIVMISLIGAKGYKFLNPPHNLPRDIFGNTS